MSSLELTREALKMAFQQECHERILRAAAIVENQHDLCAADLDRIHQEFDTLYGAARAIHFPDMERLFRTVARYARFLRDQANETRAANRFLLLKSGIDIAMRCCIVPEHFAEQCVCDASQWLAQTEAILGERFDS